MATFTTEFNLYVNAGNTLQYAVMESGSTNWFHGWNIVTIVIICALILGTAFGNILTIVAIAKYNFLHTPSNYLIASLSAADLMVAIFVMPLSLLMEMDENWKQRKVWCEVWISLDVLCCTASILSLCVIALDRYLMVTYPFSYKRKRSAQRIVLMIMAVWLASLFISIAPLFGWKTPEQKTGQITCQISQDKLYTIFSTFGAFFIPMTIILVVYFRIYLEVKYRVQGKALGKYDTCEALAKSVVIPDNSASPEKTRSHTVHVNSKESLGARNKKDSSQSDSAASSLNIDSNCNTSEPCKSSHLLSPLRGCPSTMKSHSLPPTPEASSVYVAALERFRAKQAIKAAKEHKAAKTLGIVTGVFLVCWFPFFILALVQPFYEEQLVPDWVNTLVLWLGYFNSMLNPLIYTKFNPEFQKAFQRTLQCQGVPVHV